jgi:ubiquinone/menaquinone biosynthesis C-methylase UbiE
MTTHTHDNVPETEGATITWWAPLYDACTWLATFGSMSGVRKSTVKAARLKPGEAVLDVGCGTGDLTLRAARRVDTEGRTAGIDASPDMVKIARRKAAKKGRDIDFRLAPIEDLPFDDGEFDAALSSFMIHHLPDDLKLRGLTEVRRVLKPGGRFVAVDLKPGKGVAGFLSHLMGHRLPADYAEQLRSIISEAGFEDVEILEVKSPLALFIRARR